MHVAITQEGKLFPTGVPRHHIRIFSPIPSSHPAFLRSKALSTTSLHLSLHLSPFSTSLCLWYFSVYIPYLSIFLSLYLWLLQILSTYQLKCQGAENP